MQLGKDSCGCGHVIDHHDSGRGGPCNYCACSAGVTPSAFEVGVIHSLHEITLTIGRLVREIQTLKGAGPTQ